MNTRPTIRPTTVRFRPISRAEFSPIGSLKRRSASEGIASAATHELANATAKDPLFRLEPAWPAWHRGPLDRLQPELTRYRD